MSLTWMLSNRKTSPDWAWAGVGMSATNSATITPVISATATVVTDARVFLANIFSPSPFLFWSSWCASFATARSLFRGFGEAANCVFSSLVHGEPSFLESHNPPRICSSEAPLFADVWALTIPVPADFSACAVTPVVGEPLGWVLPPRQVGVVGEATHLSVASVQPATPIGLSVLTGLPVDERGTDREHLRAAGRAVEHSIGQAAHLGMAALLAGVPSQGVRQGGYAPEGFEHRPA